MAINYPGPYVVKINYTVDPPGFAAMDHVCQLNVDLNADPTPGDTFANIDVNMRVVADHPLSTVVDEIVALMVPFYNSTDATFNDAELWKVTAGSFDMSFISSYSVAEAGTSVDTTVPASQSIMTFRTFGGGVFKHVMMETTNDIAASVPFASFTTAQDNLADYFIGSNDSPFLARDDTYPLVCLKNHDGLNEAVFKKRYRT
jgi:hypothetical protein